MNEDTTELELESEGEGTTQPDDQGEIGTSSTEGSTSDETVTEFNGITEEQGEQIIELLTEQSERQMQVMQMTGEIPEGMTFEQGVQLIESINNLSEGVHFLMVLVSAFFVWAVIRAIYNLFNRVFLGGL